MLKLDPEKHKWMNAQGVQMIRRAIGAEGGAVRIVGGAVRDALIGREVADIDFATTLPPERVIAALAGQGIKVVPTGLKHGTVTAVHNGKGYEITTLRRDTETDGRHAQVVFTDDWQEDACRRDFTFNAFYLDEDGTIADYFGGYDDLKNGIIRFIGEPEKRIAEDYLRILRAFRFMAQLSGEDHQIEIEARSLRACMAAAPFLVSLSAERVWHEIKKLLAAVDPLHAVRLMVSGGALVPLLPEITRCDVLASLIALEKENNIPPCPVRRLAALCEKEPEQVATKLRLSRLEEKRFLRLSAGVFHVQEDFAPLSIRQKLYHEGRDVALDGLLIAAALMKQPVEQGIALVKAWENPVFPLSGRDLMDAGLTAGKEMGDILRHCEAWWCSMDFKPSRQDCLEWIRALVSETIIKGKNVR